MKKTSLLIISMLFFPFIAASHNFQLQQHLPPVGVSDKGELFYNDGEFSYKNWNSAQLNGKVRVLQLMAGRSAAKEANAPLIEAIKKAGLPHDRYQTTTIVNTDDAIIGTAMFVRSSIESGKKEFPWSQFVVDSHGVVKKAWHLPDASSTIVLLDKQGLVQFAKDGALTPSEIQQVMTQLQQLLQKP